MVVFCHCRIISKCKQFNIYIESFTNGSFFLCKAPSLLNRVKFEILLCPPRLQSEYIATQILLSDIWHFTSGFFCQHDAEANEFRANLLDCRLLLEFSHAIQFLWFNLWTYCEKLSIEVQSFFSNDWVELRARYYFPKSGRITLFDSQDTYLYRHHHA